MKQLHTGEGLEGAQLTRRSGEVLGDEQAICGRNTGAVRIGQHAVVKLHPPAELAQLGQPANIHLAGNVR